ncbi:ribonuclease D [Clavibacter zhangzhiyongii]|uniref:ribonuclease D n=1 Tax=Clavibacter TaxID=1573 RepID=UPI0039DF5D7E
MGASLFSDVPGSTATDAVAARSRTRTRREPVEPVEPVQPAPADGAPAADPTVDSPRAPRSARRASTAPAPASPREEQAAAPSDAAAPARAPLREAAATGVLTVIDTREEYLRAVEAIAGGTGPVAVDAERASGFRYSQRAYLIQVFRRGAGTFLFDPPAVGDFSELDDVIRDVEWVLHAASQDLACLREVGLDPQRIFDTELASRLLGLPRVGLGTVVEELLGIHLAKEHSAADWSTRPLPRAWLVYAALDVELLVDVRDEIARRLEEQGKSGIAEQEFQATIAKEAKPARVEPWRRLSGLHGVRGGRNLAVAKELWEARDAYAREVDTSPGRLVPDGSLVAVARVLPQSKRDLAAVREFSGRASRSEIDRWWAAVERGLAATEFPQLRGTGETMPPPKAWADKDPAADRRLKRARVAVQEVATSMSVPQENLLTPEVLRRVAWTPPADLAPEAVAEALASWGARPWQIEATAAPVAAAFVDADQADDATDDGAS